MTTSLELEKQLRLSQDGLIEIGEEFRMNRSLNSFFMGRVYNIATGRHIRADVDERWTADGLTVPLNYKWLSVISRAHFYYPTITFFTKWVLLADLGTYGNLHFGLEAGADHRILDVKFQEDAGVAYLRTVTPVNSYSAIITTLLPSDYDTVAHRYTVAAKRNQAEFYIDDSLVGVCLLGLPEAITTVENVSPYCIWSAPTGLHGNMHAKVEVTNNGSPLTFPLDIWALGEDTFNRIMIAGGDPCPARQYLAYTASTSTKWNALAVTATAYTSHPVPTWGYKHKTLFWQATGTGVLAIQIYAGGGWLTLKTFASGDIAADTLETFIMTSMAPIARLVYTPDAAQTITAAEWFFA